MIPKVMDSLEIVEMVMLVEEIFGTDVPDNGAEHFGSLGEMVDWLDARLTNDRPNEKATALLKKLAKSQQRPELAEGLRGT
jgi:hypothetical protein